MESYIILIVLIVAIGLAITIFETFHNHEDGKFIYKHREYRRRDKRIRVVMERDYGKLGETFFKYLRYNFCYIIATVGVVIIGHLADKI